MSDLFDNELQKVIDHISQIPITERFEESSFGYDNPAYICIDAVLSIRRQYFAFVVPRIDYFKENNSDIDSLISLLSLIEEKGYKGFQKVWNYNHPERVEILENLIRQFLAYNEKNNYQDELKAMKNWALSTSPNDYRYFGVPGIGMATFQYLRMLCGAQTVKPDVHIKNAINLALDRQVSDIEAIVFIELASQELDLPTSVLDHNIWRHYAEKPSE